MRFLFFSHLKSVRVALSSEARKLLTKRDQWLTTAEQASISGIKHAPRRDQSMAARVLLKQLLVKAIGCEPMQVRLVKTRAGGLSVRGLSMKQHVSVSHSGSWMASALASQPVGVDVQENRRLKNEKAFRRRILSKQDQGLEHVKTLDLWVLKEAVVKARGRGLVSEVSLKAISARRFRAKLGRMSFDCELRLLNREVRLAVALGPKC
jgi:phosphopantetheinyl transferase